MIQLNGYVKIHRKLLQWGWYSDSVVKDVFLHLLIIATFKDGEFLGHPVKAGQAVIGYDKLSSELGFSVQQIRTALKKLESTGEITRKSTNKFTLVTVANWEDYQLQDSLVTNEQQTSNKPITNDQQHLKNVKNVNKEIGDCFEELWKLYPVKKGKGSISDAQKKKLYSIGLEEMTRAITRYKKDTTGTEPQFLKHGSTFFNSGYIDYLDANYEDKPQEQPAHKFNL